MTSLRSILGIFLTFAWGLLLYYNFGRYEEPTIYFAVLIGIFGSLTFLGWKALDRDCLKTAHLEKIIWFLVLLQLALLCRSPKIIYVRDRSALEDLSQYLYLATTVWAVYGLRFIFSNRFHTILKSSWIPLLAVLFIWIAKSLVVSVSPNPLIDVHFITTQATDMFLEGKNPYSGTYPEIYGGVYGYKPSFSYWPGSLFIFAPFRFLGLDIRYALLFFDLIIALVFGGLASRFTHRHEENRSRSVELNKPINSSPNRALAASYAMLWFTLPISFFELEQAWLDTIIMAGAIALLWCLKRDRFKTGAILAGAMVSIKQYAAIYVLFAALEFVFRSLSVGYKFKKIFRLCGLGLLSFSAFMLPLILINPSAFYNATIEFYNEKIPLRLDALSLRSWVGFRTNTDSLEFLNSPVIWMTAFGIVLAWSWVQLKKSQPPRGLVYCVSSLILFSWFFLFGTHSFCNQYYFLALWPLMISVV